MYSDKSKAGAATYRRRALAIKEAAESGCVIAERAGHKRMVTRFRNVTAWADDLLREIEAGRSTK